MHRIGKNKVILIVMSLAILLFALYGIHYINRPKNTNSFGDDTTKCININYENIYKLPYINNNYSITCTGLTYDNNNDSFWVCNYGDRDNNEYNYPSIINISSDFTRILSIFKVNDKDADLQGIAYDSKSDSLWYTNGKEIINCDKEGNTVNIINLKKYKKYSPNGIAIDSDGSIWCLCYYQYLLHYSSDGKLIDYYECSYQGQDHLCFHNGSLYFSVGEDYTGSHNYIVKFNMESMEPEISYKVHGSYAVEGICFAGDNLFIANDGYYHNAKYKYSYVAKYSLLNYK